VAKPSIIFALAVAILPTGPLRAVALAQPQDAGQCSKLYSDDEAKQLVEAARKAVPRGRHPKRKDAVLKDLGVAPDRLCNRRQGGANLGYKICWQVSPSFDVTWWLSAFDGPPSDRDDRRIYSVRITPRQPGYLGTQCPMTDEERGLTKKSGTK
jgi:hypothetical protein